MKYSKLIQISSAGNRRARDWQAQRLTLEDFYSRLRTPTRSTESLEAYLRLSKAKQDDLKDVGGFVFGVLEGGRRKANAVKARDGITLDADNIPAGDTENIIRRVEGLGCGYAVYSTRKHRPGAPRLRIIFPLDRSVTADEYEPAARKIAELIDPTMAIFDPTTFESSRLMYWPSCCSDSEYIFKYGDKPLISADGLLEKYDNWHDWSSWPQVPGVAEKYQRTAARQQDPEMKTGIVGAWCRVHSIEDVLTTILSGVYSPTDIPDRWSYSLGSTTGGALVYDDKFMYSHHATDPASGQLCNSFDLCRLHLFGDRDEDIKPGTPANRFPSYKEMVAYARADAAVAELLATEKYEAATADLAEMPDEKPDVSWMQKLKISESGRAEHTANNVLVMLEGDTRLKGRIKLNEFTNRIEGLSPLPWAGREKTELFEWTDYDSVGLRLYTERLLGFRTENAINDALIQTAREHAYNPVQDYLRGLVWDGKPRLETVFIDYFAEKDTLYVREVGKKSFVAAVARAFQPGIKFDTMIVISGPQGTYKSTFIERIGVAWAATLMVSFGDPKAVVEIIKHHWLIEIPELSSFSKADTNTIKQMISQTVDEYRAAYARITEQHKRQCVLFGTTNDREYLKDPTGNRRFWPIDVSSNPLRNVWSDLTREEVDQLWAEAVMWWRIGESLALSKEAEVEAEQRRGERRERDDLEGIISAFLERPVPLNWRDMDANARDLFLAGALSPDEELVQRDRICVAEIVRECLEDRKKLIKKSDSNRIARILDNLPGWERGSAMRFGKEYGKQRGWKYVGIDNKDG